MIGLTNNKCISQHIKECVNDNNVFNNELNKLRNELNKTNEKLTLLETQISILKEEIIKLSSETITINDINELVIDIKESFNMFINATPRNTTLDDAKLTEIMNRINVLEQQINSIPVEFSIETNMPVVKKNIPKLDIKKTKKS